MNLDQRIQLHQVLQLVQLTILRQAPHQVVLIALHQVTIRVVARAVVVRAVAHRVVVQVVVVAKFKQNKRPTIPPLGG